MILYFHKGGKTLKDRIKALRKKLGLTQEKFSERLSIKRNTIAKYETGRNEPIDAVISLICKEFDVNEEWLRTGKGGPDNMFKKTSKEDEFTRAAKMIRQDHDANAMNAVIEYWKLDPSSKQAIWNFIHDLSKHMSDNEIPAASTPKAQADITLDPRDTDALSAAVREAEESYIKSRSGSARRKVSSASSITDGEGKDAVNT